MNLTSQRLMLLLTPYFFFELWSWITLPLGKFFFWASSFKACLSVALTSDIKTLGFSSHLNLVIKKKRTSELASGETIIFQVKTKKIQVRHFTDFSSIVEIGSKSLLLWPFLKVLFPLLVFMRPGNPALFDPRIFALIWVKLYSS